MKLLIITQAVDAEDSVLGFFVRWIEELSKCTESIEIVCLKEGMHNLPANVHVHSLGKEKEVSRTKYVLNFYKHIWLLRHDYDSVFVHMNQEYVLLGGWFWRLLGKKVVLWRNHKMGSLLTRLAVALSNSVCHTSPDSFVARYKNAVAMSVGIDTDFFTPASTPAPVDSILFLGRLDPVKKVAEFIGALAGVPEQFHADLYGSPTEADSEYARQVYAQAQPLIAKRVLTMHSGVTHERTRELYQSHAIYVNLTPSGSFDKTIGEAVASGCIVVCANNAMEQALSPALMVWDSDTKDIAHGISAALGFSGQERTLETHKLRSYIEEHHSLKKLVGELVNEL